LRALRISLIRVDHNVKRYVITGYVIVIPSVEQLDALPGFN